MEIVLKSGRRILEAGHRAQFGGGAFRTLGGCERHRSRSASIDQESYRCPVDLRFFEKLLRGDHSELVWRFGERDMQVPEPERLHCLGGAFELPLVRELTYRAQPLGERIADSRDGGGALTVEFGKGHWNPFVGDTRTMPRRL